MSQPWHFSGKRIWMVCWWFGWLACLLGSLWCKTVRQVPKRYLFSMAGEANPLSPILSDINNSPHPIVPCCHPSLSKLSRWVMKEFFMRPRTFFSTLVWPTNKQTLWNAFYIVFAWFVVVICRGRYCGRQSIIIACGLYAWCGLLHIDWNQPSACAWEASELSIPECVFFFLL